LAQYYLNELSIEGFRGINNEADPLKIKFKPDCVNSIFAPNAQGKSSIYDAICYAIKGYIPKLSNLPSIDHPEEYYANRFHSSGKSTILLTFKPSDGSNNIDIMVERESNGNRRVSSPTGFSDPEEFLNNLDNEFCLLDQKTFQKFIDESPLNRGRTFSSLVGLGLLSQFRQGLELLSNSRTINSDFEIDELDQKILINQIILSRKITELKTPFKEVSELELSDPINTNEICKNTCDALKQVKLVKSFFLDSDLRSIDFNDIRDTIKSTEKSDQHDRLVELTKIISELKSVAPQDSDSIEKDNIIKLVEKREAALNLTKGELFKSLYDTIVELYDTEQWKENHKCPVCYSEIQYELKSKILTYLEEYETVNQTTEDIIKYWNENKWIERIKNLFNTEIFSIDQEQIDFFTATKDNFEDGELTSDALKKLFTEIEKLDKKRSEYLKTYQEEKEKLEKELPPSLVSLTEKISYAEQIKNSINAFEKAEKEIKHLQTTLSTRTNWKEFIEYACKTFSEAEVSLSSQKTLNLEQQYQQIYSDITNNPNIIPKLHKSEGKEDLFLSLKNFYGLNNVSATTLLAESYRNALAISIYLASSLDNISTSNFLLLDDVTSSFDAGHQFNLMELIRTKVARPKNSTGAQIIILSHDGLLEKYFDRLSSNTVWYHQKILGLPPKGSILTQQQDLSRLRTSAENFLNAGQIQQAEPLIRQYLEFKLLEIIRKVNIKVPVDFSIRDDKKMVQNCLDNINESVNIEKKLGTLILEQSQIDDLEKTHIPSFVSNWLSHYSTGVVSSLSPYILLGVLDTIDAISDCFKYDCKCSGAIKKRYYRSPSKKDCSC